MSMRLKTRRQMYNHLNQSMHENCMGKRGCKKKVTVDKLNKELCRIRNSNIAVVVVEEARANKEREELQKRVVAVTAGRNKKNKHKADVLNRGFQHHNRNANAQSRDIRGGGAQGGGGINGRIVLEKEKN